MNTRSMIRAGAVWRHVRRTALLALFGPWSAASAWMFAPPADGKIAADLHLGRETTALENASAGGGSGDARVSRIGIRYAETFGESVIMALSVGYASATRGDDPEAAGMRFTGSQAAIDFRAEHGLGSRAKLILDLRLSGSWLSDERNGNDVRHDRLQGDAGLGVLVRPLPHLLVYGGPTATILRIDEDWSGNLNRSLEFDNRRSAGWRAGAAFELDEGGWIALEGSGGAVRGVQLTLLRRFQK